MPIPQSKAWLVDGFCRFTTSMVRRNFHCFAIQLADEFHHGISKDQSLVVYANHIGWWDPIVAMLLRKKYFADRTLYAPIDANALEAYAIFKQLGFYGLKLDSFAGASDFLKTSREILSNPKSSIWITPEGVFTDCRDLDRPLMPGLAHLAATSPKTTFVPLAIEYPFWEEPKPLIACRFGAPISFETKTSKAECGRLIFESLRNTQRDLAQSVMRRDLQGFHYVLAPKASRQGLYDTLRAWKAWIQGRPFDPSHAAVTNRRK
jgi:1-acyl-sn-glycerol-3-phosphate acyltransferase